MIVGCIIMFDPDGRSFGGGKPDATLGHQLNLLPQRRIFPEHIAEYFLIGVVPVNVSMVESGNSLLQRSVNQSLHQVR